MGKSGEKTIRNILMTKVLILAYDFPPYVSVGGLRPYSWYKYLKKSGLYPVVITRQWANKYGNHLDYIAPGESNETIIEETPYGTIIRAPFKPNLSNRLLLQYGENKFRIIRKIITAYYEFMQFLFFVGPKASLYREAKKYLKTSSTDFIVTTGEPFVLFKYASSLSKKHNIPWIADYRDLWSQNKNRSTNKASRAINCFFEKKYLGNASAITTVSALLKEKIHQLKKDLTISVIPNGYDSELLVNLSDTGFENKKLNISFAGTIYNWHPWQSFLKIINELYKNGEIEIALHFYGINKEQELKEFCLQNTREVLNEISFNPKLPNEKLVHELSKTDLLLLFNDYSIMGTKIYDYLAVKRHILFCYAHEPNALVLKNRYFLFGNDIRQNQNMQADLIKETNSGVIVRNESHLEEILKTYYVEFKKTGKIACESHDCERYSRKNQVKLLAELINKLT